MEGSREPTRQRELHPPLCFERLLIENIYNAQNEHLKAGIAKM
jgi:hypothetical protein